MDIRSYLNGCTRDWLQIIQPLGAELIQVLEIINYGNIQFTPKPVDMFNFAKFPLLDTKVIIIGMDPYPTAGDAHGLSFSSLASGCPASVNRIFGTLVANKLLEKKPPNWNLTGWALQGVLLLNSALSVQVGKPGSHIKHWRPFMNKLITAIINTLRDEKIVWCLWGNDAQQLYDSLMVDKSDKHVILRGVHPVAMVKPSFNDCTHFLEISKLWPDFIWDVWNPQLTEVHLYTDCSARNNQSPECQASWGVVCTRGVWKGRSWNGIVEPFGDARPTNIRGEGFGLIKALMLAQKLQRYGIGVKIFTDSKFWLDMLYTYIPRWVEQSVDFNKKKNPDIVQKIWPLFQSVMNSSKSVMNSSKSVTNSCEMVFVNAWHDIKPIPQISDGQAYANWHGNKLAEECAEAALGL
jgi:uracil-DNA glycosylase